MIEKRIARKIMEEKRKASRNGKQAQLHSYMKIIITNWRMTEF